MKTLFVILFSLCFWGQIFAQNQEMDSLKKALKNYAQSDSNYINTLNELAFKYYAINPDSTLFFAEKGIFLSNENHYSKGKVESLKNKGIAFWAKGDYTQALNHYQQALPIAEKTNYFQGLGRLYNNIALIYRNQGRYPEALENYFKALKIREKIADQKGIAASLNNIGLIYYNQNKYTEALNDYFKALNIMEKINDKQGIAYSLNNIALIYEKQGKYAQASENQFKSLKIKEEIGDKKGIAMSLNNIANIYNQQGKITESLETLLKCLKICEEIGDKSGITRAKDDLAKVYFISKNYAKALIHAQEGLIIAKNIGEKEKIRDLNETLSKIYELTNQAKNALFHYKQFKIYADSLNNSEVEKKTSNLQAQYEYDKKVAIMQVEQTKKDAEQVAQRNQLYWLIFSAFAGLISLIIILFLIFRSRKKIQNAYGELAISNAQVQQAKEEIEVQAEELAQNNQALNLAYIEIHKKNEDVTASINYAKRIQNAILPFEERIEKSLGKDNFFILFKPKDIVSGDFYWFEEIQTPNEMIKFMVVADCTGHGVPGAFMSMIGNQLLHEIIIKNHIYSPDQILNNLHKEVHRVLRQKETNTNDGMDISMLTIEKNTIFNGNGISKIQYAGAMNPLYYVQNNELKEIKATKRAIGGKQSEEERFFEKHEISLQSLEDRGEEMGVSNPSTLASQPSSRTTIYLCTDGYQDQFGGENGRKFMVKKLRELLLSISHLPLPEQNLILGETFDAWKGKEAQVDDVTILGIRL